MIPKSREAIQADSAEWSIFLAVMLEVILRKNIHMNMGLILNGYRGKTL